MKTITQQRAGYGLPGERTQAARSNIANQISQADAQGFRNFSQCFQRGLFLRPFDFADVIAMHVGFFRQLFLAQPKPPPPNVNRLTHNLVNFRYCHMNSQPERRGLRLPFNRRYMPSDRLYFTLANPNLQHKIPTMMSI